MPSETSSGQRLWTRHPSDLGGLEPACLIHQTRQLQVQNPGLRLPVPPFLSLGVGCGSPHAQLTADILEASQGVVPPGLTCSTCPLPRTHVPMAVFVNTVILPKDSHQDLWAGDRDVNRDAPSLKYPRPVPSTSAQTRGRRTAPQHGLRQPLWAQQGCRGHVRDAQPGHGWDQEVRFQNAHPQPRWP